MTRSLPFGHNRICTLVVAALLSGVAAVAEENLLVNPSFEALDDSGQPKGWDNFVLPNGGAYADSDVLASEGSRSVMLRTLEGYEEDPANNWSQVVYGDFGGKTLVATVDAHAEGDARPYLWLQCFQKTPLRVLAAAQSSDEGAERAASTWTQLSVSVDAPAQTDFVVVRCVIAGTGSVWFDEVGATTGQLDATEPTIIEPSAETEFANDAPPELDAIRQQMQQALDELRDSNTRLRGQIATLETELQTFRDQLSIGSATTSDELEMLDEPRHILLPREP